MKNRRHLDRILLKPYLDKNPELYHQARNLFFVQITVIPLLAVLAFITPGVQPVLIALYVMLGFVVASVGLLRLGFLHLTTVIMIIGMAILSSALVFAQNQFFPYEVYLIATAHMFILSIAGLITYRAVYPYGAALLGIVSVILAYLLRAIPAGQHGLRAHADDYIASAVLLALGALLVGRTVTRSRRLLQTAQDELEANQEKTEELLQTTTLLNALIDQSPVAMVIRYPDGSGWRANSAFLHLVGLPQEANASNLPPSLSEALAGMGAHDTRGLSISIPTILDPKADVNNLSNGLEVTLSFDDGRTKQVICHAAPITGSTGRVLAVFGVFLEITQRRQLEGQLQQSQKLEAVGRLAGGVAHDFNNLLTVINGYTELLNRREDLLPEVQDHLESIGSAGQQAARLTNQLLVFARRQAVVPTVLNLNTLITEHMKMLGRLLGENIEITTELAPDLSDVKMDRSQVEQIITNLAVNARDAMPGGGELTIVTANRSLNTLDLREHPGVQEGPFAMLVLNDTGHGMDDRTLDHVFEPFYTTKGAGKGSGLGLSTVHGIVTQNGGFCSIYSRPGAGTSFRIFIPIVHAQEREAEETEKIVPTGNETILLVEDDAAVLRLAQTTLARLGYSVLTAPDGPSALEAFRSSEKPVDLLLTDVIMPGMSGKDLVDELTSQDSSLKFIYASGYTGDVMDQHGIMDAADHFLQKPFTTRVLAEKVREVLDTGNNDD